MKSTTTLISHWNMYYPQWITGLGAIVIFLQVGIMCGWSSPYIEWLTSPESPFFLTPEQASWVASLLSLGQLFGSFCGAITLEFQGSKKALTLTLIPIICCWIFTIVADSYAWLVAARLLGGIGMGMTCICVPFFVGEVAISKVRGAILSLAVAGGSAVGMALASVGGSHLSMKVSAGIYLVPCILVGLLYLWIPDSPHWLVKKKEYILAKSSVSWYQPNVDSDKEVEIISSLVHDSSTKSFFGNFKKFRSKSIRKAFTIIIVLSTAMQVTGLNTIGFYMETILVRSKLTMIEPSTIVIYVNVSSILATFVSMFLIERCGRKFLFVISSIGIAISMAGLGANAYLISLKVDPLDWQWLPVASIFTFMITFFVGMLGVPSAVLSEIFPSDIKFIAGFVANSVMASWSFAVTRSFQSLVNSIGEAYVFWLHGTLALLFIPYIVLCMPETKGKTLQEIQDKFITSKR